MSYKDKFIFNVVLNSRLKSYGHHYKKVSTLDMFVAFFIIPLPMGFEYKAIFTQITVWQFIYNFKKNIVGYNMRVMLFYRYYFKELMGEKFTTPFLSVISKK